jgi:hypothetical protein
MRFDGIDIIKTKKDFLFHRSKKHHTNPIASSKTFFSLNCSERNFECFSLLRNGSEWNGNPSIRNDSERNYKIPSVFLFWKMVRNGISNFFFYLEWIKIFISSVFRGILFLSENGSPICHFCFCELKLKLGWVPSLQYKSRNWMQAVQNVLLGGPQEENN